MLGIAALLDNTLANFDWETTASQIAHDELPGPQGVFNVTNDAKFARLDEQAVLAIINAFRTNTSARSVQMAHLRLGESAARAWADVLRENTTIEVLNLEGNAIGSQGVLAFAKTIREGCK